MLDQVQVPGPQDCDPAFRCWHARQEAGTAWIGTAGELDLAGAPELEAVLRDALSSAQLVVVDLDRLTFLGVAGVHVFVDASVDALLAGRRVVLQRVPAALDTIFALTGTSHAVERMVAEPVR